MVQAPGEPDAAPEIHRAIASLQRLSEAFLERRHQLAREAGISESQWRLLEEIAGQDFMPSMFARRRDCTAAAVSRGLRALRSAGLVRVAVSAEDGRQRVYSLTKRGTGVLEKLRDRREAAIAAIWQRFPPEALLGFERFATALADDLEAYARERA